MSQRTRTDKEKKYKRDSIYKAAVKLFRSKGYDKVSFNGIASEAGFTKSNMYRYFTSKEEIFLNIYSRSYEKWVELCEKRLKEIKQSVRAKDSAQAFVESLIAHSTFLDLAPLLHIALEKNSSFQELLDYKKLAKQLSEKLSLEICRIYPEIDKEWAFKLLDLCHGAMCSFWKQATSNDVLDKIYQFEDLGLIRPSFEKSLVEAIEIFILGIRAKRNQ